MNDNDKQIEELDKQIEELRKLRRKLKQRRWSRDYQRRKSKTPSNL
jgi:hypothetical protein